MTASRKFSRRDANQSEIVKALRAAGASVTETHQLGSGFPDIVVGYQGTNFLIEIKNGRAAKLTEPERRWHDDWLGTVDIVRDAEEALMVIGALEDAL